MYNKYIAQKKKCDLNKAKVKQQKIKTWVDKYYNQVQPALLQSYDKRINTFIRKMEQNPTKIHLEELQASNLHKLFRNVYQKDSFVGDQSFRFRDKQDWKSLLTPMQRLQRMKNKKFFQDKFGSSQFAFRSIGSQSEYKSISKNQFRVRNKSKQINPPMKYTYKLIINNPSLLKSKQKLKNDEKKQKDQGKSEASSGIAFRKRTITHNSGTNFGEDDLNSQIQSMRRSNKTDAQEQIFANYDIQNQKDDHKLHFKKMVDLQQNIQDQKTKKGLKNILIKCGVYRTKDKRMFSQLQTDHFEQEARF